MRFTLRRVALLILLLWVAGGVFAQEATPEATPEPAPLVFTDPEGIDLSLVIATIGDETITLGDYATRMRYEFARYYRVFDRLVNAEGPRILDLQDTTNNYARDIINVIDLLTDPNKFPAEIYRLMVLEALYRQEAQARNVEFTECQINTLWASTIQVQLTAECVFPEDFDQQIADYIALMTRASGISAEMMERITYSRTAIRNMQDIIADDLVIEDQPAVRTRHLRVRDEALAQSIFERIQAGEDFMELLAEFTVDSGSVGNRGELGFLRIGQTVPEFDFALFNNPVGLIQQPVQTQFGYHIIEILEIGELSEQIQLRQIVLATEDDANIAVRLLNEGTSFSDLVTRFSLDNASKRSGGLLNALERSQVVAQFNQAVADAVFAADEGALLSPIQTARGWHVFRVESKVTTPSQVRSRHILVSTLQEAESVLERINNGENFGTIAAQVSIDPSARGANGDTLTIFSEGASSGLYIAGETRAELDAVVFDAEVGDIVGPIQTRIGFYIIEVLEKGTRAYTPQQVQNLRFAYIDEWELAQETSGRVVKTELWRRYIPTTPLPSETYPNLVQLNLLLQNARENLRALAESTNLINTLRSLRVTNR